MTPTMTLAATYMADASIQRFSVRRYQAMIDSGILTPEDHVELLENLVVLKLPKSPMHDGTIDLAGAALRPRLLPGWILRIQQAIALVDSQPEPDFAVVRGDVRAYLGRHPGPDDIALLIEVAHSSILRDQRDKARIYARAGIAVYWIINLADNVIEVYEQPSGPTASPGYGSARRYRAGDDVPLPFGGSIPAAELLP
jgi:Uma2 family endonuclease